MRRILSLMLAVAILLSMALTAAASEATTDPSETLPSGSDGGMVMSEAGLDMIRQIEGFSVKPYWDVNQWTVGYGTSCPSDKLDEYKANGITEEEADALLRERIVSYENAVKYFAEKYGRTFTQTQFDALVSFTYNLGSGWVHKNDNFVRVMSNPNATEAEIIFWFAAHSSAGGSVLPGLVRRRLAEANLFLNGVYGTGRPENYCYVKLDANGGSLESRINAYNINTTNRVEMIPTLADSTFLGWFTQQEGGKQVTTLDKSLHNTTLYAHWETNKETDVPVQTPTEPPAEEKPAEPETPVTPAEPETPKSVNVKVTSDYVNLRKGPGTNYTTVGQVSTGAKLTITETKQNGSLLWGSSEKGWICLRYTNYETAVNQPETPVEPETPETPSQPETSTVKGTVKANGGLTIRKGPGTGYASVGCLQNGARVEILEQKQVGSMTWGKISKGWISLSYVNLDKTAETTPEQTEPEQTPSEKPAESTAVTGTVKVSSSLLIRKGPGTSYGVAGSLSNGASVTISEQKQVGSMTWGNIGKGWISMNYVVLNTASKPAEPEQTPAEPEQTPSQPEETPAAPTAVTGTVDVDDYLRIRSGPGTSYSVSGYYKDGEKVTVTEQKQVGSMTWGKTEKGWISMSYIKLDKTESSGADSADVRTVTASCLIVRSGAGTGNSVAGYLYRGDKVTVLETKQVGSMTWGKIATGWICLDYTK